jgi:glycogen operon protein
MQEIRYAREVLDMNISVEPWSALGGNYSGRFSSQIDGVKEWSDARRKTVAEFFSSHGGKQGEVATQIAGSSLVDPYSKNSAVIGTGRSHDGFSLLGAFEHYKDTRPNGEEGRDGSPDNYRKSSDRKELYQRAIGNAAFDILSKGVPFMRAGDERGYSSPNNNPYCIDDESVWIDWKELSPEDKQLFINIKRLNAFRQKHPVFNSLELFSGEKVQGNGYKDITWVRPDAQEMEPQDWHTPYAKTIAYVLNGSSKQAKGGDDDFMVLISGDDYHTVNYQLPKAPSGESWKLVFDSSEQGFIAEDKQYNAGDSYALKPFSFVILSHKRQKANEHTLHKIPVFSKVGRE